MKNKQEQQSKQSNIIDLVVIVEMGKKYSKFNTNNLNGFKLYSQLRIDRKGGGIGLYVRNNLNAHIKYAELTNDYEILHVEITKSNDKPRDIVAIYRPPSGKYEPFILALEALFMRNEQQILLLGDININVKNTNSNISNISPNNYINVLDNYNYGIYNKAITRYNKVTQNHSIIDHIISQKDRNDILALTTSDIITENFSDHQIIIVKEYGKGQEKSLKLTPASIEKVNKYKAIREMKANFKSLDINIHPSKLCDSILEYMSTTLSNNTTKITLKFLNRNDTIPPWIDMNYINLSNRIHNMTEKIHRLKMINKPVTRLKSKLNEFIRRKEEQAAIRIKSYYSDKATLNIKEAWKSLNYLSGTQKERKKIVLHEKNARINDDIQIANIFQEYFLSIVGVCSATNKIQVLVGECQNTFEFQAVTPEEVEVIMRSLDIGKASGIDNISPFLWTQVSEECSIHVSTLINQMFSRSEYPKRLKETIVLPIHKKDSPLCKTNYRPISITNSLDKVVEKIIQDQMLEFLENENLLDKYQYGFKKRRSCEDVIAKVLSETSNAIDKRHSVILISLDLSKAFDMIDHQILLAKLNHYGIRGKANNLIRDFLSNRIQYVKINESLSYPGAIKKGIPQGTQLGPLLFSLYINDMRNLTTFAKVFKFADDTMLLFDINENSAEEIKHDLDAITNYYERNSLILNLSKSNAMIVGNNENESIIKVLNSHGIIISHSIKYLGIQLDCDLKFDSFLTSIISKLNQAIGVIAVLRHKLNIKPLMNFYFAHFHSHLSYGNFVLIRSNNKELQNLQIMQNRIIKLIYKLPPTTSTQRLYTEYAKNVLPIMGQIFMSICILVKKSLIEDDEALIKVERLRSARTKMLKINKSSTSIRANDIEVIGASIFNSLPEDIRKIEQQQSFKMKLKNYLLSKSASLVSPLQISTRNKII